MVSPLQSQIKKQIAQGFKGRLLACVLRKEVPGPPDEYGDATPGTVTDYAYEGIRDTFTLQFAEAAGVPVTDAKLLVLMGSIKPATTPGQDDKVKVRDEWFQLRRKVAADPAGASETWAGFQIESQD